MSNHPNLQTAVLESLAMPVLAVEQSGQIVYGNPAARFFWRLQLERLSDFNVMDLFGEESTIWTHVQLAFQRESSFVVEPYKYEREPGKDTLLRVQIDPVLGGVVPTELAVIAFWDLTHREHVETRVREYQLMDSIGMMAKRLAHELQNPLSGVKGAAQLLARKLTKQPDLQEYPKIMQQELGRMERLVRDLLIQGDDQQLSPSWFNLHELLDTVVWFQKSSSPELEIHRVYDPSLPDLFGDRDKLHQVFLNLIQNAQEASDTKPIVIRTGISGPWSGRMEGPHPKKVYFRIEVEDQGKGVAESDREHIFTPFFSTKKQGTGLGLSISYQIIRAHLGTLEYRDAPQGGALFCVTIPMEESD